MAANEATKEVETDESIQAMDSHLASLLQKRHGLKEAWRKNKLNRHLRTKIADLCREIESHAKTICAQQWNNTCDEADGKMRREANGGCSNTLWRTATNLPEVAPSCKLNDWCTSTPRIVVDPKLSSKR
ncbi:hypothetical protein HPB51_010468 [Rhipicephalus microplus]|uniref:Uncharacterized protein n=1 Tax=Rhipicephalus microplus TaxID=6941 RepID=A0A9J6E0J3_RHIMP|nr:hypothetical protein HPB51_010468 [Rhipicephalus microplus]